MMPTRKICLALVFMVGGNALSCRLFSEIQQQRNEVYSNLKELCQGIPTSITMEKYDEGSVIKPERGSYSITYLTSTSCSEAKAPFFEYLISKGWQPTEKGLGYYYKDNYIFGATCRRQHSFTEKNRVQISCSWDMNGEGKEFY